jgi:hypothetical protein
MTIEVQADQDVRTFLAEYGAGEIEVEVDAEVYRFLDERAATAQHGRKLAKRRAETPEMTQAHQQLQAVEYQRPDAR